MEMPALQRIVRLGGAVDDDMANLIVVSCSFVVHPGSVAAAYVLQNAVHIYGSGFLVF